MARGSLQEKGGGVGFEGIGVDIGPLMKQFEELRKQVSDPKIQTRIHRSVGNIYKKEMLANIKDAREVIRIRRGQKEIKDTDNIQIGTLRRSIRVWKIDKRYSTFWVGPRVGKRMPHENDGWFANIVEGGDQKFGGGRNEGVFERSIRNKRQYALDTMRKKYEFQIRKAARKAAKKTKK
jgi:hypothetical protein